MCNDARRMFYTQEELDKWTFSDKLKFKLESIRYNSTETILVWMGR